MGAFLLAFAWNLQIDTQPFASWLLGKTRPLSNKMCEVSFFASCIFHSDKNIYATNAREWEKCEFRRLSQRVDMTRFIVGFWRQLLRKETYPTIESCKGVCAIKFASSLRGLWSVGALQFSENWTANIWFNLRIVRGFPAWWSSLGGECVEDFSVCANPSWN